MGLFDFFKKSEGEVLAKKLQDRSPQEIFVILKERSMNNAQVKSIQRQVEESDLNEEMKRNLLVGIQLWWDDFNETPFTVENQGSQYYGGDNLEQ